VHKLVQPVTIDGNSERLQTNYGISIILTIMASSTDAVRFFLRKLFTLVFSDVDIYIYIYIYIYDQ